ncbi:hypothetical protein L9F63_021471, partial [Diploptera punctata]
HGGGVVCKEPTEYSITFVPPDYTVVGDEVFSYEYIKDCCEQNVLLELKPYRLNKTSKYPDNFDPLDVFMKYTTWEDALNGKPYERFVLPFVESSEDACADSSSSDVTEFSAVETSPQIRTEDNTMPDATHSSKSQPSISKNASSSEDIPSDSVINKETKSCSPCNKPKKKKLNSDERKNGNESHTWLHANKSQNTNGSSESVNILPDNHPKVSSRNNKLNLGRREYRESERKKIVKFIVERNGYDQVKGRYFWQLMEAAKICPGRTWQSLKEHFLKKIFPRIGKYGLSKNEVRKFKSWGESGTSSDSDEQNSIPLSEPQANVEDELPPNISIEHSNSGSLNSSAPTIAPANTANRKESVEDELPPNISIEHSSLNSSAPTIAPANTVNHKESLEDELLSNKSLELSCTPTILPNDAANNKESAEDGLLCDITIEHCNSDSLNSSAPTIASPNPANEIRRIDIFHMSNNETQTSHLTTSATKDISVSSRSIPFGFRKTSKLSHCRTSPARDRSKSPQPVPSNYKKTSKLSNCRTSPARDRSKSPQPVPSSYKKTSKLSHCRTSSARDRSKSPQPVPSSYEKTSKLSNCRTSPARDRSKSPQPVPSSYKKTSKLSRCRTSSARDRSKSPQTVHSSYEKTSELSHCRTSPARNRSKSPQPVPSSYKKTSKLSHCRTSSARDRSKSPQPVPSSYKKTSKLPHCRTSSARDRSKSPQPVPSSYKKASKLSQCRTSPARDRSKSLQPVLSNYKKTSKLPYCRTSPASNSPHPVPSKLSQCRTSRTRDRSKSPQPVPSNYKKSSKLSHCRTSPARDSSKSSHPVPSNYKKASKFSHCRTYPARDRSKSPQPIPSTSKETSKLSRYRTTPTVDRLKSPHSVQSDSPESSKFSRCRIIPTRDRLESSHSESSGSKETFKLSRCRTSPTRYRSESPHPIPSSSKKISKRRKQIRPLKEIADLESSDCEFCFKKFMDDLELVDKQRHRRKISSEKRKKTSSSVDSISCFSDNSSEEHVRKYYTNSERKKIIQYIIDKKAYSLVKGRLFWQQMEAKKICPDRTWQSLKEQFLKKILPNINTFKLSKEQVRKFKTRESDETSFASSEDSVSASVSKQKKRNYTKHEKIQILQQVINRKAYEYVRGRRFWERRWKQKGLKEHLRNVKKGEVDKSAVAAHAWSEKHLIDTEASPIKQTDKLKELTVWEKIHIQKNKKDKLMNFETPANFDLIQRFIGPPIEICPGRTWQSMKEHFLKQILSEIHKYDIPENAAKRLKRV